MDIHAIDPLNLPPQKTVKNKIRLAKRIAQLTKLYKKAYPQLAIGTCMTLAEKQARLEFFATDNNLRIHMDVQ